MVATRLEFIKDNTIKEGITYPLFNSDKGVFIVYFNSDLDYQDMVDTLANFARENRSYFDYRVFCMLKSDWDTLLDALKKTPKKTIKVSLRAYDYYSYYKALK